MEPNVTVADIERFAAAELPFCAAFGISCESLGDGEATARFRYDPKFIRPPDFVCGPVMMALADAALYFAIFTRLGIVPLALTNELTTSFLRPARGTDLLGRARLLKVGRRVATGTVDIAAAGDPTRSIAHSLGSYILPDTPSSPS